MARKQGITHVKFANKNGVEQPKVDWIAGVDCDETCNNRTTNNNDNEEEDNDPTCIEQRV